MSKQTWTHELLTVSDLIHTVCVNNATGCKALFADTWGIDADANAHRIVECWNACLDMQDPAKEIAELRAQRDALKEALNNCDKAFVSWQVGQIPGRPEDILAMITNVREALAATEEKK